MQGKVSMVVPCYNKENYIGDMLRSVYEQIWDNIELILVNDGSTDATRAVIEEWIPKLEKRGYDVVLIDQDNAGCCAAVLSGLNHMTGDYFCLVDADDEIFPEYVSRMAGWLDNNADCQWAACSFQPFLKRDGQSAAQPPVQTIDRQDDEKLLERHMLRRVRTTVWIYMTRVSYIKKCGLIENFCGERRATYEPPIIAPLAAGGGKLKFFDEPLYKYNRYASDMYYFDSYAKVDKYYGDYLYLYEQAINRLEIDERQKRRLLCIARLSNKKDVLFHLNDMDDGGQTVADSGLYLPAEAKATAEIIDGLFSPPPNIAPEFFARRDYHMIFTYLEDIILGNRKPDAYAGKGRVIGYGILGKYAAKFLPVLAETSALPSVMWDAAAVSGEEIYGIPVTAPDFSALTERDTVLVFPASGELYEEVRAQCGAARTVHVPKEHGRHVELRFPGLAACEFLPGQ